MLLVLIGAYRLMPGWFEEVWFNRLWWAATVAVSLGLLLEIINFVVS